MIQMIQDDLFTAIMRYDELRFKTFYNYNYYITCYSITSFWEESSGSDTVMGSRTKFAQLACQLCLVLQDRRAAAGVVLGQPQLQELFSYLEAGCMAESLAKQSLG